VQRQQQAKKKARVAFLPGWLAFVPPFNALILSMTFWNALLHLPTNVYRQIKKKRRFLRIIGWAIATLKTYWSPVFFQKNEYDHMKLRASISH
jgi:hypothetical protein